jgi:phytanoyl-CoA hydroxylase
VTGRQERAFFEEHGWLVVRGVVPPDRVAELERALDAVVPQASYVAWGERVVEVAGVTRASAELAGAARDPDVARLGATALGATRLQLLQDTALIKPAASAARVEWHQDYSYLGYLDRPGVATARIALTPCIRESGCMRVLDGSHHWGFQGADLSFRRDDVADTLSGLPPELRARASAEAEVALELAPGDISLHHCLTFHASAPNGSAHARKTLVVRLVDGACRLIPERLPAPHLAAYFPTDEQGHLVPSAFPVVWPAS